RDRFEAEAVADGFGQVGLIFDDQDTRARMVTSGCVLPAYRKPHTGGQHHAALTACVTRRFPRVLVAGLLVVSAAIVGAICYQSLTPSSSTVVATVDGVRAEHRGALGEADGDVPDGTTVFDDDVPGVAKLDPALLGALRRAATDAAADGVKFFVNSGWRSRQY